MRIASGKLLWKARHGSHGYFAILALLNSISKRQEVNLEFLQCQEIFVFVEAFLIEKAVELSSVICSDMDHFCGRTFENV